jgi:hypothetical protein
MMQQAAGVAHTVPAPAGGILAPCTGSPGTASPGIPGRWWAVEGGVGGLLLLGLATALVVAATAGSAGPRQAGAPPVPVTPVAAGRGQLPSGRRGAPRRAAPERLSRGLVLVKWWLLAIPHLIIVGLLAGGGLAWQTNDTWGGWTIGGGGGIIGLLVLVAGIVLLFSARYPQGLFDIVMGLNRWVYRVLAYVALMTDEYPPFRLDSGGPEPQPTPQPPAGPPPADVEADLVAR